MDDRARSYAEWLVANESKKGTEEFDAVASAYRQARSASQSAPKPPPPDVDSTWGEYGKNLLRQAAQGITFNFGDEITAGARSVFGDETYDQALADERSRIDEFSKRNPWASTAANVGGALVGGGGAGLGLRAASKAGGALGRLATGATNAVSANPIGAGGITGAASGALAGFGEGEGGLENRLTSAGMGALVGGVGGTAAGAVISSLPALKRVYQERVAKDPDAIRASADKEVGKALERSGKTPDEIKARLQEDRGLGVPSTLMNADDELAKTGEVVVAKGGKGAKALEDEVRGQRNGTQQRTFNNLQKGVTDADFYASEDAILDSLKKTGAAHYDNAPWMSQEVTDPRILQFLQTPVGKQSFSRARSIIDKERIALEMEGKDASHLALKDLFTFDKDGNIDGILEGARPDLRTLDLMKRGMQSMIDDGFASANGLNKADASGLKKIKDVYLKALDGLSPEYRQARAAYRGDAEVRDALELGKTEFLKMDPQGLERAFKDMSDGEREAYKIGAMKSIRERIFDAVDNADPTKKAGEQVSNMRDKWRILVGDPEKADLMMDAMTREADVVRQGQRITGAGQSRTARLGEAIKDFDGNPAGELIGDVASLAISPTPHNVLSKITRLLARSDFRMTELKADEVSKILRSGTPDELDALFKRLSERQAADAAGAAQLTDRAGKAGQAIGDQSAEAVGVDDPSTKRPMEITIHPKPRQQQYARGGPVERKRNFAQELASEIQRRVPKFAGGGGVRKAGAGALDILKRLKAGEGAPELAKRYPSQIDPVEATDKTSKKLYWAKDNSEEALAVQGVRKKAQKDIDRGNYDPFFDVSKRADVDPSNYPTDVVTVRDTLPKKQVTIDEWTGKYDTPESRDRIQRAFDEGMRHEGAPNWYYTKQLEDEYIARLGPEEGRRAFQQRFANSMAATTGGASPTDNLVMAGYGNFLKSQGAEDIARNRPVGGRWLGKEGSPASYDFPFPVGGRFAGGNMEMFTKQQLGGAGGNMGFIPFDAANPKRHDFEYDFLGHRNKATIDERMSNLIKPGMNIPQHYGVAEQVFHDMAAKNSVDPRFMQEVAWAGATKLGKKGDKYTPKPMIQIANEAIERTRRITGLSQQEIMDGIVRGDMPLYKRGGLASLKASTRSRKASGTC